MNGQVEILSRKLRELFINSVIEVSYFVVVSSSAFRSAAATGKSSQSIRARTFRVPRASTKRAPCTPQCRLFDPGARRRKMHTQA